MGDVLPRSPAGIIVSVADKVDSLVGLIGTGCAPSASADPYGLRRTANGLLQVNLRPGLTPAACNLTVTLLLMDHELQWLHASPTALFVPALLRYPETLLCPKLRHQCSLQSHGWLAECANDYINILCQVSCC